MASLTLITKALSAITPAQWCQIFFGISSATVLAIQMIPKAAQHLLLDYGARSPASTGDQAKEPAGPKGSNVFMDIVRAVASVGQIPHSWFMHFYVTSIASSAFWAWQYLQGGSAITSIAAQQAASETPSMRFEQTVLVWALMALQVSLRETTKPDFGNLLSPTAVVGTVTYLYGWINQHLCHKHLASLKKYSLPDRGLFRYLVCPHYTCECLIYLGLAITAAPEGLFINRTVLCALWFIVANLGTTADGTKEWYAQKFGSEKVAGKWRMIPFIF
ncbi:putative 3-oxo-5-alpha-steroid 4-dehydrogenase [Colletotrichum sublineola]|uniref:Polyprenal reductase n=1 Tax=Colletotrichum sublineola TaxID=1173701 RepID=A0A066X3M7_COLSU|nr:putative 3-oxo-5-alpha-steroid 4-dehydrogenase [Colletotrichum sublineola]